MRDAESPRAGCGAALLRREWIVLPTPAVAPADVVVPSFRPTAQTPTRAPLGVLGSSPPEHWIE
jgi:hypothetical protein